MEGAISKDATSLSKSIYLILFSSSFTFHSLLYFPVALLDLEIIFASFGNYVTVHLIDLVSLEIH